MARATQTIRLFLSFAIYTCLVRTLLGGIFLELMGCAVQNYAPPRLPIFMQEQLPEGSNPLDTSVNTQEILKGLATVPLEERSTSQPVTNSERNTQLRSALPSLNSLQSPGEGNAQSPLVSRRGLTLEQAILTCLEADPQIRAGMETIRQAQADLLTSSLPPNPGMLIDSIFIPLGVPFTTRKPGGPTQIDVGANYPIDGFLFGKRAAAISSARLGVDVSVADFTDLVRQRVAGTIVAFYDVLEAQALLALAREDLADLKQVEKITAQRVALGGVGTIELDRVRLAVFDSQREVRARETARTVATAQLRAFLGFRESDPAFTVQDHLEILAPAPPLTTEDAVALAEQYRPDLLSLRQQLAKAEADLHLEETRAYPDIAPGLAWTRQFQPGVPDASSFSTVVNFSVPLFDRNQGNIAKAQSARTQAALNVRARLVALRSEVEQAVQTYQAAYQTVTADDPAQLKVAENVRDKIKLAYELGGRPLIEVLDAQRAYRDTYRLYITGRSGYWHALYQLNAVIGKQVVK